MKPSGLWSILVLSVLFVTVQGRELNAPFRKCPRIREQCEFRERDLCTRDRQCQGNKKCCVFSCGKKCLDLSEDICSLPQDPGPCLALFSRWWYDEANNTCNSFFYGGCQGNFNNFQTEFNCQNACLK